LAFIEALNATPEPMTSAQPGNIVCVPPGTYKIGTATQPPPRDLTILGPAAQNGGALIGPNQGVAQIVQYDNTQNILDSCPLSTPPNAPMPVPSACSSFYPGNTVQNWRVENITLAYSGSSPAPTSSPGATAGPLNGWAPSAVYFPSVSGLEMHNVIFSNAFNCYDFGSQASPSASQVAIVENTAYSSCNGHFLGLLGAASNFSVVRQAVRGGRGEPSSAVADPFLGMVVDTTAVGANAVSTFNFLENDFEGSAWGMLWWLSDGTSLQNVTASGNICDSFTFGCYAFIARPNQSATPSVSEFNVYDKWGTAWYSPLQFDGGGYAGVGTSGSSGVGSIQFSGGLFSSNGSQTNASSVFFVGGSPVPGGYASDGSSLTIQFPTSVSNPWSYTVTAAPGDTPRTIVERLVAAVGCTGPPSTCVVSPSVPSGAPIIGTSYLANPYYAPVEMYLQSPPPQGTYSAQPYIVITTGNLYVVNNQAATPTTCPLPTSYPAGATAFPVNPYADSPAPCWTGAFDQGDAAVIKNAAHDIQFTATKMRSANQASIHIISGGDYLSATGNVLGSFDSSSTFDCLRVEAPANPNFHFASNDCTGAVDTPSPIIYPAPSPSASVGFLPVIRNNRGSAGFIYGIMALPSTLYNYGPFDCTYYVSLNGGTASLSLAYPGGSTTSLPTGTTTVFLPVGASLTATTTGSPMITGFCLP